MKGLYILLVLILVCSILGYLVFKPTDSDLRRTYENLSNNIELLNGRLVELKAPLSKLREYKRRTFKLDKDYDFWQSQARGMEGTLRAARHNIENLSPETREVTGNMLATLRKEMDQFAFGLGNFAQRVNALHDFVTESFPLLSRMNTYRIQINRFAEEREKSGNPLPENMVKQLESYNLQCDRVGSLADQALKAMHSNLNQGITLGKTTINQLKNLLPTIEAFIEDLDKQD